MSSLRPTLILAAMLLGACGGGGSSDSAPTGSSAVPKTAPARPVVHYAGNTAAFRYDGSTATDAASIAWLALDESELLATQAYGVQAIPAGVMDSGAGTALHVQARSDEAGLGFVIEDFDSFVEGGESITGRVVVEVTRADSLRNPLDVVLSYDGLTIHSGKYALVATGTLVIHQQLALPAKTTLDMDLLFSSLSGTQGTYYHGVHVDSMRPTYDRYETTLSGRVFDVVHGYIDWSTDAPLEGTLADRPTGGGSLLISGGGPALRATPYNSRWTALEMDLDSDGIFELSRPLAWDDMFDGEYGLSLDHNEAVCNVGGTFKFSTYEPYIEVDLAKGTTVESLLSSVPDGSFVTHRWKLLVSPIGSNPSLSGTSTARLGFTTDTPGEYVVSDTISAGPATATRRVALHVLEPPLTVDVGQNVVSSLRHATLGVPITMRLASDDLNTYHILQPHFVTRPAHSAAVLSVDGADGVTFTPDADGIYEIQTYGPGRELDFLVAVGASVATEGAFRGVGSGDDVVFGVSAVHDLDGDGLGDFLQRVSSYTTDIVEVDQIAPGRFSAPRYLPASIKGNYVVDVDEDGRADILDRGGTMDLHWWKRAADGTYVDQQTLTAFPAALPCDAGSLTAHGHDGSGRLVVFFDRECGDHFVDEYAFDGIAFVPVGTIDLGSGSPIWIQVADVDGDGLEDLIVDANSSPSDSVRFFRATSTTTFDAPVTYTSGFGVVVFQPANDGKARLASLFTAADSTNNVRISTWNGSGFTDVDLPGIDTLERGCFRAVDLFDDARQELDLCGLYLRFAPDGSFLGYGQSWTYGPYLNNRLNGVGGDLDGDGTPEVQAFSSAFLVH